MSLQKGAATFRVFSSVKEFTNDVNDLLRPFSYKEIPQGGQDGVLFDITRGVSLVGSKPTEDVSFVYGNNIYFAIRKREKIVNPAVVKECLNYLIDKSVKETGEVPRGKRKKELKETAIAMAQNEKVLKMSGIRVVGMLDSKMAFMDATSISKIDEANEFLISGPLPEHSLIQMTPETLYSVFAQSSVKPESLQITGKSVATGLGMDFLTWLWAVSDTTGGYGDVNVTLCGDICLRSDENATTGPMITKLSKGSPWSGDEPKAAFNDGKKVSTATFRFSKDSDVFEVTLDETLLFNKFKRILEEEEEKEEKKSKTLPEEEFFFRMEDMKQCYDLVCSLFKTFVESYSEAQNVIDNWIEQRWGK